MTNFAPTNPVNSKNKNEFQQVLVIHRGANSNKESELIIYKNGGGCLYFLLISSHFN